MFSDGYPDQFGGQPHPAVQGVDTDRDRVEIQLVRYAVQEKLPFLGICRGIQMVNVALGGSLYTHVIDQHPDAIKHDFVDGHKRDYLAHEVNIQPDSRLASILKIPTVKVNSLHHQGLRRLAPELKAAAYAPDGLVESVEIPAHPFGVAVQWHPEWLQAHAPMRALFKAFVEASQK
jgi:putative glutamine amidotransferase